jgi:hypothetical protein
LASAFTFLHGLEVVRIAEASRIRERFTSGRFYVIVISGDIVLTLFAWIDQWQPTDLSAIRIHTFAFALFACFEQVGVFVAATEPKLHTSAFVCVETPFERIVVTSFGRLRQNANVLINKRKSKTLK